MNISATGDLLYDFSQSLFPIVQGSVYHDLRTVSAEYIARTGADGNAIGGLSVGEPAEVMYEITDAVCRILPQDKPRYLMGVGTPANILESIALGIDMFDCVIPTRNGRNAMLFTRNGIINIKNENGKRISVRLKLMGMFSLILNIQKLTCGIYMFRRRSSHP